jgi:hypothetical protein
MPRNVGAYVNYLGGGCKNLSGIVGNN